MNKIRWFLLASVLTSCYEPQKELSSNVQGTKMSPQSRAKVGGSTQASSKDFPIYSCKGLNGPSVEICFEVNPTKPGNDSLALQMAKNLCGSNKWIPGESCPKSGVREQCLGAVLESGLTYDKFTYSHHVHLKDECSINGGQS